MEIMIRGRGRRLAEEMGWQPERAADVSALAHEMTTAGFDVSQAARRFLTAFSGLRAEHLPSLTLNGRQIWSWTEFDPRLVCTNRDARVASRCANVVGEPLCPVGVNSFHLTVYITPSMSFFAGMDASVYEYGAAADEFFARLADGARPQPRGSWNGHHEDSSELSVRAMGGNGRAGITERPGASGTGLG